MLLIELPDFSTQIRKYALARFFQFLAYQMLLGKFFIMGAFLIFFGEIPILKQQLKVFEPLDPRQRLYNLIYLGLLLLWKGVAILSLVYFESLVLDILFIVLLHLSLGLESLVFLRVSIRLEDKYHGGALRYVGLLQLLMVFLGAVSIIFGEMIILQYLLFFSFFAVPGFLVAWVSIFPQEQILGE